MLLKFNLSILIVLILICILCKEAVGTLSVLDESATDATQATLKFYTTICNALIEQRYATVVSVEEDYCNMEMANKIIRFLSPCPVIIVNGRNWTANPRIVGMPKHIFMFMNSAEDIAKQIRYSSQRSLWNIRAYIYFVICRPVEDQLWLNQTLEQIWKNNILHFVVSYYYGSFQAVTYNPFFHEIIDLTKSKREQIYQNKFHDMNRYQLRVGFFADPPRIVEKDSVYYGIDAMIMMGFGAKLKATIKIVDPGYANIIDEKYLRHFLQVKNRQVDFGFVSCFPIYETKNSVMQMTYPRRMDGIVVLVPHSSVIPQFYYMFMMFDDLVWIFLCTAFLSVTACIYFQFKCLSIPADLLEILVENWSTMLSMPIPVTAFQVLISIRILLLLWIINCTILTIHFQSLLTSELITPKFQRNMETLNELKHNNTIITINKGNSRAIVDQYPTNLTRAWFEHRIKERITSGDTTTAYAIQSSVAELVSMKRTEDGYPVYHIIKELLVPGYTAYLFPLNSPYLDEVNKYILLDQQFGLSRLSYVNYASVNTERQKQSKKIAVITLRHLQSVFYIFLVGIVISIVAFFLECAIFKATDRKINTTFLK